MSAANKVALVLACGLLPLVVACSANQLERARAVNAEANKRINAYCDARAKAIEALGEAGGP